ncbi:MAG TPA: helix-turn-helix transcriptional regulator [Acidimicrobiia bacterium]|jgi:transcriptional regulator with XRE-family HTH domain
MNGPTLIRRARARSGLSLRALAERAGTSHSTLAAYEAGRISPTLDTLERILGAAGFTATITLTPRAATDRERGRELRQALELAAQFPARHAPSIEYPVFGRRG